MGVICKESVPQIKAAHDLVSEIILYSRYSQEAHVSERRIFGACRNLSLFLRLESEPQTPGLASFIWMINITSYQSIAAVRSAAADLSYWTSR